MLDRVIASISESYEAGKRDPTMIVLAMPLGFISGAKRRIAKKSARLIEKFLRPGSDGSIERLLRSKHASAVNLKY